MTNSGSISVKTGSSGSHGTGVNLNGGGSLTNNKGATVYGYGSYVSAVYLKGSGVSADNSGTIKAVSNTSGHVAGVNIAISSGILHNETTGTISASGYHTAAINATVGGTVYNYGSVDDSGAHGNGVYFVSGGSLTNSSLITETGGDAGVGLPRARASTTNPTATYPERSPASSRRATISSRRMPGPASR